MKKIRILIKGLICALLSAIDQIYPKGEGWVFLVGPKNLWNGDHRALYECLKTEFPQRNTTILGDPNTNSYSNDDTVLRPWSYRGVRSLLSARVVVIHHGSRDAPFVIANRKRVVCNVWHGMPIKGVSFMDKRNTGVASQRKLAREWAVSTVIPATSKLTAITLAACFRKSFDSLVVTGLPRDDVMLLDSSDLPAYYRREEQRIRLYLGGKKLILYAPTFNDSGTPTFDISGKNATDVNQWLENTNFVFGIRRHVNEAPLCNDEFSDSIVDLGHSVIPDAEILLRCADILITDGSSIWIQFLLRNQPLVWLGETGSVGGRGLMFDVDVIFPGARACDICEMKKILDPFVSGDTTLASGVSDKHSLIKRMFHQFNDAGASRRLLGEIDSRVRLIEQRFFSQ